MAKQDHSDDGELESSGSPKQWVRHLQIRNNPQLDSNIKVIQRFLPGAQKSQIVNDAVFLFAETVKARQAGAQLTFNYPDGKSDRIMLMGGSIRG